MTKRMRYIIVALAIALGAFSISCAPDAGPPGRDFCCPKH
jgi:hypothetical protein